MGGCSRDRPVGVQMWVCPGAGCRGGRRTVVVRFTWEYLLANRREPGTNVEETGIH